MTSHGRSFEGDGSACGFLLLSGGPAGHWSEGGEQLLVHHLLYTFTYVYIFVIIIILFLFSILGNSFISIHKFYFVLLLLLFFNLSPHPTVKGGRGGDQMSV